MANRWSNNALTVSYARRASFLRTKLSCVVANYKLLIFIPIKSKVFVNFVVILCFTALHSCSFYFSYICAQRLSTTFVGIVAGFCVFSSTGPGPSDTAILRFENIHSIFLLINDVASSNSKAKSPATTKLILAAPCSNRIESLILPTIL